MRYDTVANIRGYNLLIVLLQNKSDKVRLEGKHRNGKKREELRRDGKISSNMGRTGSVPCDRECGTESVKGTAECASAMCGGCNLGGGTRIIFRRGVRPKV